MKLSIEENKMKRMVLIVFTLFLLTGCNSSLENDIARLSDEVFILEEKLFSMKTQQVDQESIIIDLEKKLIDSKDKINSLEKQLSNEKNNSAMMLEQLKSEMNDSIGEEVSIEIQRTIFNEVEKYLIKEVEVHPESNYVDYRIEEISHVIDFENINNRNISLYRVNYRLKSLTPENILMAGGMDATEDGWIYTFSPNATYLIFENNELYLCDVLINDAQPHTEVFKQDVERRLLELDNE